ncbi:hypothetical protein Sme01_15400 [Sphaerisporangium melleum]|uniref:PqqD family protein n=1 Tax=Sphaerisporangium melleum TaxID=321316 RepID=A0A917RK63_9ACTN|nr:PqqD family protein [Sphaerisporangium melleum]GGL11143.1 hypothetical protein GCM10007964_61650 [Sphaerisporangium melleum]GII69064.1 hypothetical protein Sme01_15400 [Sphaerisporangium melleum]
MTLVRFHQVGFRRDGDEWIVGRVESGDFVAVPHAGVRAIRLLQEGRSVEEAGQRLLEETGVRLDVRGFVAGLTEAGLVAAVDGKETGSPAPPPPTLPGLRAHHVRWTLSPWLHAAMGAVIAAGAITLALNPWAMPDWHDLLWSSQSTLVLLTQIVVGWTLILLHELAHLTTARAAGVPGRIRLGTRLQFLAAQTDVSGIWLAERRVRMTVYLAGMAVDCTICAICAILIVSTGGHPLLPVVMLTALVMVATQFLVFMRNDLYFVLQDVTGCRNLYRDSGSYLRYLLSGRRRHNPLTAMPPAERRVLRWYTPLAVLGTAGCVAVAALVTLPATVALLLRALAVLWRPSSPVALADALVTVSVIVGFQALWARAWWGRHGARVRRLLTASRRDPAGRG